MKLKRVKLTKQKKLWLVYSAAILILLLFLFFLNQKIISVIFTVMLIVLGCVSSGFKKITGINLGIEFITFATILFLYSYGFAFAMISCLFMVIISALISGNISPTTFTGYGMYLVIGVISFILPFTIMTNGIILTLILNIFGFILLIVLGFDIVKNGVYIIGNTIFNIILFTYFSQIIFGLL